MLKVTKLVGTKETVSYIKEYKLAERKGHNRENICFDILVAHENGDIAVEKPSDLEGFVNEQNKHNCTWEAMDLLKKLLTLDFVPGCLILRIKDSPPARPWTTPSSPSDLNVVLINMLSMMQLEVRGCMDIWMYKRGRQGR